MRIKTAALTTPQCGSQDSPPRRNTATRSVPDCTSDDVLLNLYFINSVSIHCKILNLRWLSWFSELHIVPIRSHFPHVLSIRLLKYQLGFCRVTDRSCPSPVDGKALFVLSCSLGHPWLFSRIHTKMASSYQPVRKARRLYLQYIANSLTICHHPGRGHQAYCKRFLSALHAPSSLIPSPPSMTKPVHVSSLLRALQWPFLTQIPLLPVKPIGSASCWPLWPHPLPGSVAWVPLTSLPFLKRATHVPTSAVCKCCSLPRVLFHPNTHTHLSLQGSAQGHCYLPQALPSPGTFSLPSPAFLHSAFPIWHIYLFIYYLSSPFFPPTPAPKCKPHKSRNCVLFIVKSPEPRRGPDSE